ncbi:FHA domain-containing protein [Bradyrhizobium sp. 180]|uniref:FHA domain-containing protein n=1 Tax=Bradyrhizobium sp. 180 TaxID=2782650 RepID=UPI001FF91AC7|nr:FHA domain-containing protein [Bradyrhizobium sp. 180]MCK1489751.1 FHA domain-containing protein [Bradyrhizobium sp. 180]
MTSGKNKTTIAQGGSDLRGQIDLDSRETQVRRGSPLATLLVLEGPGAGTNHPIYKGDNAIGRSPQNRVSLAFGDDGIHREGHAWILAQVGQFVIEHGGKRNPVFVNDEKLQGKRSIKLGDRLRVGATTLRLDPA